MEKALIFGTGPLAELLYFFLKQENNVEVGGFVVDSKYRKSDSFLGLPLVDFETAGDIFPSYIYIYMRWIYKYEFG